MKKELSILIPTKDYVCTRLVKELVKQAMAIQDLSFESKKRLKQTKQLINSYIASISLEKLMLDALLFETFWLHKPHTLIYYS